MDRHVRTRGPERSGVFGTTHGARSGDDRRRDRGVSRGDLLDIARSVARAARAGEQVEAYVVRTRDTDVEVFDGDVESLTTASVEGVGIRVIAGQRQGLAWAGSLAADVIDETLQEARDNAGFGEHDEWYG